MTQATSKIKLTEFLLALQQKKGMNDESIIEALGCSRVALSNWRSGNVKPIGGFRKRIERVGKKYFGKDLKLDWTA
jgi:transcriptional regulator with XRE-family HTH domain